MRSRSWCSVPAALLISVVLLPSAAPGEELPDVADLPRSVELPDPLRMFDGSAVESREQWFEKRRPELQRLIQHYMYGYLPPRPEIDARVTKEAEVLDGRARLREVEIRFADLPEEAPRIRLAVFLPKETDGPAPVFVALNKCGNQEVIADEAVSMTASWLFRTCPADERRARGRSVDFWCLDYLIERGYGLATFHESDVDPDRNDFTEGIHPFYPDLPGPPEARTATLAAWAWGLSCAVDYLRTDETVDRERICLIGHSRRGKAALLAAAIDDRVALVVPHQSGTGGMALSRPNRRMLQRMVGNHPHWLSAQFKRFDDMAQLPFDQHLLTALVAPRPLLTTEGMQDPWYDESVLQNLRAASQVYEFLGVPGLRGEGVVDGEEPITAENTGRLLQVLLDEVHTLHRDYWGRILDFADLQWNER